LIFLLGAKRLDSQPLDLFEAEEEVRLRCDNLGVVVDLVERLGVIVVLCRDVEVDTDCAIGRGSNEAPNNEVDTDFTGIRLPLIWSVVKYFDVIVSLLKSKRKNATITRCPPVIFFLLFIY
jgi:hypothetical protein